MTQERDYLTINDVAAELRITRATVRKLMLYDGLTAVKVGSIYRIARTDLDQWIAKAKEI